MIRRAILMTGLVAALAATALATGEKGHYGAPFTDAKAVAQADAMARPGEFAAGPVKIRGTVKDVCQAQGCWLVLTDGEREMRVHMKDHAFAVPKDLAGKTVVVEGVVETKTINEAQARHFAEESKSGVDPASIKGDQTVVRVIASGVEVE
jgi:hypothetical protein